MTCHWRHSSPRTKGHTADLFTTAAVPGRSTAVDVWHPPVQQQPKETERNPRPTTSRHRISSSRLDSRWSAIPSSHPNPTERSRHRVLPQRRVCVSKSPSAQMETRHSNGLPPTNDSHDTSSLTAESNGISPVSQTEWPNTGSEHSRSLAQTQERTPQHQTMTMTTWLLSPAS